MQGSHTCKFPKIKTIFALSLMEETKLIWMKPAIQLHRPRPLKALIGELIYVLVDCETGWIVAGLKLKKLKS